MSKISSLTHEWHGGGNTFIRPNMRENAGEVIEGHSHNFHHLSILFSGWRIEGVDQQGRPYSRDFKPGSFALIPKGVSHKLTALPHEVETHTQALLDAMMAVAEGRAGVETLAPAVAEWRRTHDAQPHVFWCVYAHREPQGDVVQDYTGWPDAYR
jgi:hypothetical protein